MNHLFAPGIPAERIMAGQLRVWLVDGDGMEPDLKSRRDYVMVAPTDCYVHEGLYLVNWGCGNALYRASKSGRTDKPIRMRLDNPLYHRSEDDGYFYCTRGEFDEMVLGFVVADIRVRDEPVLRRFLEGGKC
jgi:hypothetical protein